MDDAADVAGEGVVVRHNVLQCQLFLDTEGAAGQTLGVIVRVGGIAGYKNIPRGKFKLHDEFLTQNVP